MQNDFNRNKSSKNKSTQKYFSTGQNQSKKAFKRNDLSQQSIKKFKLQIDHDIAKCLDTIDRQGLKYLRQTLKASNIFNSLNSKEIQENIQISSSLENTQNKIQMKRQNSKPTVKQTKNLSIKTNANIQKSKQQLKQKQRENKGIKKNTQKKKIETQLSKSQKQILQKNQNNNKKDAPKLKKVTIQNKKTHQKIGLGDRISKKMQQLQLKTGKKPSQTKQTHQNKKQQAQINQLIQEQIVQNLDQQEINPIQEEQQKQICKKKQQMAQIHKKTMNMNQIIENDDEQVKFKEKNESEKKIIKPSFRVQKNKLQKKQPQTLSQKKENMRILQEQIPLEIQKQEHQYQLNQEEQNLNSFKKTQVISQHNKQIQVLLQKIFHLSPSKFHKLQKILDQMENDQSVPSKTEVQQSRVTIISQILKQQNTLNNESKKQQCYQKEKNNQSSSIVDEAKDFYNKNQRDSFKKKQKKQKASTLFLNNSKSKSRIIMNNDSAQKKNSQGQSLSTFKLKSQNQSQFKSLKKKNQQEGPSQILKEEKQLQLQKLRTQSEKQQKAITYNKSNFNQQQNLTEIYKSDQRMVKMNKKQKNKEEIKEFDIHSITFRVLSNYGHSTLFGLTGIQIYLLEGQKVQIGQSSLLNSKASVLFNNVNLTIQDKNMYISTLQKPEIIVQNIRGNIGGIKIYNFNKSSENMKEVDQMEIQIDKHKIWKGKIKRGSYNQYEDYGTKIYIFDKFIFDQIKEHKQKNTNQAINLSEQPQVEYSWLQKQQIQKKMKQIQDQEKQFELKRNKMKNQSVRQSSKSIRNNSKNYQMLLQSLKVQQERQKIHTNQKQKSIKQQPLKKSVFQQKNSKTNNLNKPTHDDILVNIQKINQNKQKQSFTPDKNNNIQLQGKNSVQKHLKQQSLQRKVQASQFSQFTQEKDFNQLLVDLHSNIYKAQYKDKSKQKRQIFQKQQKKKTINSDEDFMNDSLFQQKPKRVLSAKKQFNQIKMKVDRSEQKYQNQNMQKIQDLKDFNKKKTNNDNLLDDIIGQLDGAFAGYSIFNEKAFQIPNLPNGKNVQIQFYTNWGHQNLIGLNGIQFFDSQGNNTKPISIKCSKTNQNLIPKLINKLFLSSDQKKQFKINYQKSKTSKIQFQFSYSFKFSLIRIWNYNGHRVHSNIGLKFCVIKINQQNVFMGDIQKSQSTPQNCYKYCQNILFTENSAILKKIKANDWLTQIRKKNMQQKNLFLTTLKSFNRPKTNNNQNKSPEKNLNAKKNQIKRQIKIPKRNCLQYDPPQYPSGFSIKLILHNTWGDTNFIGLNGIEIFNQKGFLIEKQNIFSVKAYPSSTGQTNDKRVVQNLFNGKNYNNNDQNIWLSIYQSDIQKLQLGRVNFILVQFSKCMTISAINIFNYSKTVQRGVRQIQIEFDNLLAFRGYIRKFDSNCEEVTHTTINFTKDIQILKMIDYNGYNQDNMQQEVGLINQKKVIN